jgi:type VI secretion system protein ImpH
MAGTNGHAPPTLEASLLAEGHRFAFFQALRLLNHLLEGAGASGVRVRPDLSLSFPASDIARIEKRANGDGYTVTASFLGLYGTSSPLPAFYTEDLFRDGRDDSTAARDFIDILHHRLYALLFESWKKYRLFIQVAEFNNHSHLGMLYAIAGLSGAPDTEDDPDAYALVRYTGLFGGHARSALALQTLLADVLRGIPVEIISCVPRRVKIAPDQRLELGGEESALGKNSFIGEELMDVQGKFRVRIGPVSHHRFRALLHGGEEQRRLARLIDRFVTDPLEYDFQLTLARGHVRPTCLGAREWSRLGLDTVLFAGNLDQEVTVTYPAAPREAATV